MSRKSEAARLDVLRQLELLDTPPSEAFDRITRMAAQLFGLPIAAVSLTDHDRQWFKSRVGVEGECLPRNGAPCAEVTDTNGVVIISDLLAHPGYRDSPLAQSGVRFYAGTPLTTRDDFCLGAMCVLGKEPRRTTAAEIAALADLAAMVMSQIELQHAFGRIDAVSGLPNRNQFLEDLQDLARDRPDEQHLAALVDLADADQLASAARVMGPGYVDELVEDAARMLRARIARKVYHVGTTQFAFLAPDGIEQGRYAAELDRPLAALGRAITPRLASLVIGLAPFRPGEHAPRDVLRAAHGAAQDARSGGRTVSIYSPALDASHKRRFLLLDEFGSALEAGDQLSLVYQPRIDLASGACTGAEALLRWEHPALGQISPAEFMPLVEQTSMARAATAHVLEIAIARLASWHEAGMALHLSVNVSAANLVEPDLPDRVLATLGRHGLPPSCLELEITESAVMENAGQALALLTAIAASGIRLAIDDFGTGYSSLSYLQRLPAQVVKIDQSFMQELAADERKQALVSAMISLAHDMGYHVVAEGVETGQVLDLVAARSCDEAQGFFFGRPMAPADFVSWRQGWRGPVDPAMPNWHRPGPHPCPVRQDMAPQTAAHLT